MRLNRFVRSSLLVLAALVALVDAAAGQTVWSGLTYTFNHPANSTTQDDLTPNASLTRGPTRGLYNAAYETSYFDGTSPEFTLWATQFNNPGADVAAIHWADLIFDDWQTAYGGTGGLASNIVDSNAVVYLTLDEIYLDISFTSWAIGNPGGGAFSYQRAEPPILEPTGDYNGDQVVDAADYTIWRDTLGQMVTNPGDGADGDESGTIDAGDFIHWKERFGDVVAGAGPGAVAVPEPTTIAQLFGGLLMMLLAAKASRK